jgi:hypothetical protein|tara:strand:+ start:968 stop:1186 length:219 start_codon:yes stop_codon:yes gene_type:complete
MADFDNQISLWKRQPRETDVAGKGYPHYQGKVTMNGVTKDCAVWIQTDKTKDTQPDMSGKISEPFKKEDAPF